MVNPYVVTNGETVAGTVDCDGATGMTDVWGRVRAGAGAGVADGRGRSAGELGSTARLSTPPGSLVPSVAAVVFCVSVTVCSGVTVPAVHPLSSSPNTIEMILPFRPRIRSSLGLVCERVVTCFKE